MISISPHDLDHYAPLLRKCGSSKNLEEGKRVHAEIATAGLDKNGFLRNLLIEMYGKCGSLKDAKEVFDGTGPRHRNLYTWNMIIAAYVRSHHLQGARELFDAATERCEVTWNTMIAAYTQRGDMDTARSMFDKMPRKNAASWNTMIAAYAQKGHLQKARDLFDEMGERSVVTWNSMVTAYAQHGHLQEAKEFFNKMPVRNVVSWNALIAAYVRNEDSAEALRLFGVMDLEGVRGDAVTITGGLDACANLGSLARGREIHSSIAQLGFTGELAVENSLVNMYGKCQSLADARETFERMKRRDVVSWTVMLSSCCRNREFDEALVTFRRMILEGERPDEVAFISALEACGDLASVSDGRMVHAAIAESGSVLYHSKVESSLISMYGKCGSLREARAVLERLHTQDAVSWTAMIASYAQQGLGRQALELFHAMALEGVSPDEVTLVSVLCACNHAGRVHGGRAYFQLGVGDFGVEAQMEHYACMVDMLGRSGRLVAAEELMAAMPFEPDVYSWMHLLSACKTQVEGMDEQGHRAARLVAELEPEDGTPYVMLSSMYSLR
ncbi:pentatricopeptide repeat-containing protein At4g02750 [Selaginella moellendorffii]|nr:pentatricopeptide repeat-containing protein At4g02750 [Selaginella moellendorffii]|eukprot:XP_002988337.2 pentatricopeptide repeat-containing protein At4g02750 [Selaginella moellendorffii]